MRRATDRIGQEAQEIVRTARDEGKRAIDDVKSRATERIDDVKSRAADRADEMARAADAAASELEKSGDGAISGYGHSLASMMRQLAGGLRDRDIEDFAAELAQFARRHPAAFLAGSVAVGFGIARILKAQNGGSFVRRARSDTEFYGDYGDYDEDYREYDERYEAGEYDSGRWGSEYGSNSDSAQRDRGVDSYTARDYGSSSRSNSDNELPGGRYTPGNTGASSASSTSGYGSYGDYGGSGSSERDSDSGISGGSRSLGGTDQSGLYGDRPTSSPGFSTQSGSESSSTSTTASPTSAPASSGTSSKRDYRTASPDGDPFGSSDVTDEDRPIETPESEANKGPRKGDLP